jgi:SNF2 family DNA or RNA helicase
MEQGTGKTKVAIDTAAYLYAEGKIDAMLIVAPNGVQKGWVLDQIPDHMPDHVPVISGVWDRNRPKKIEPVFRRDVVGLRVLAINYEAIITPLGKKLVNEFLNCFRVLWINDESHRYKGVKAKVTQFILENRHRAAYRRNLTGTPSTESPMDLWPQMQFLDPHILGFSSITSYRAHFAHLEPETSPLIAHIKRKLVAKYGRERAARMAPQLIARDGDGRPRYRNLDQLSRLIQPYSYRCLLKECADLPSVSYEKLYVTLNPVQRRTYDALRDSLMIEIDSGMVSAALAITRMMRLQQVTGGFVTDNEGNELVLGENNPKLDAIDGILEDYPGKIVIWARFIKELRLISEHLEEMGIGVARYWGEVSNDQRRENKIRFIEDPNCRVFVGQVRAGGTGVDGLQEVSNTMVYFSNEFGLTSRLQSESRTNRIGQTLPGVVIDIEAEDTLDRKIIQMLRAKKEIADCITLDEAREWI